MPGEAALLRPSEDGRAVGGQHHVEDAVARCCEDAQRAAHQRSASRRLQRYDIPTFKNDTAVLKGQRAAVCSYTVLTDLGLVRRHKI